MDIEALQARARELRETYYQADRALKETIDARKEIAIAKIHEALQAEKLDVLAKSQAWLQAKKAVEDAEIEQSKQATVTLTSGTILKAGDRVIRIKDGYGSMSKRTLTGILEVVTRETVYPDNAADWRKPSLGAFVVRLLTKDGQPGKKFEVLTTYQTWKKVE